MAIHSNILAWRIPWTEEPGRATVHRVTKTWTRLKQLSTHALRRHMYILSVLCHCILWCVFMNSSCFLKKIFYNMVCVCVFLII